MPRTVCIILPAPNQEEESPNLGKGSAVVKFALELERLCWWRWWWWCCFCLRKLFFRSWCWLRVIHTGLSPNRSRVFLPPGENPGPYLSTPLVIPFSMEGIEKLLLELKRIFDIFPLTNRRTVKFRAPQLLNCHIVFLEGWEKNDNHRLKPASSSFDVSELTDFTRANPVVGPSSLFFARVGRTRPKKPSSSFGWSISRPPVGWMDGSIQR